MPTLTVGGVAVNYTDAGSGDPVLLLHSGLHTSAQWRGVTPYLAHRFRVLALDFYNMGGTGRWPGPGLLTCDDDTTLVEALADHLRKPVHVVGHSYGGTIAIRMALQPPPWLRSLTVIEPLVVELLESEGEMELYGEYRRLVDNLLDAHSRGDADGAWQGFFDYRNGKGAWRALPEDMRVKLIGHLDDLADMCQAETVDRTMIHGLRKLRVPTLIAHGEHTTRPDIRTAEIMHGAIPGSRYEVIRGAAHMSPLTHPQAVATMVADHLDDLAPPGA